MSTTNVHFIKICQRMMRLLALLVLVNLVVVVVVATPFAKEDATTSEHFLVKDINYEDLISGGDVSSDIQRIALEILKEDGIIALSGIPSLAEAREDAFIASASCIFQTTTNEEQPQKIAPVKLTLEDGSTRYSWGAHVHHNKEMMPFTPSCPELQSKMETLREIVDRGALVFGQLLDSTIVYKDFNQGLFSSATNGQQYSSFQRVIQKGKHLDHFHVYGDDLAASSAHVMKKKRTLELHTDQGLFIGFIPSIQVLDNFIIKSKVEDRLVIETKQNQQKKAKFPRDGNVLVFMLGEGINLVKRNSIIQSLRPLPHALDRATWSSSSSLKQGGIQHFQTLRAWFGRMFFPPSDAIIPGNDNETFESFMTRIRNASINNDRQQLSMPNNNSTILSLACDHSAQGAMQSRLLQDATGNDCSAGEVYCWMSCLPIDALPCDKDSIICQKQNGQIWEPCDTCHDPTSKLVCSTTAPTPSRPVVHREFDLPLGLLHLWFNANGTHAKFRLQGSERGYIGFGLGSVMISSLAIIGMDPTANSHDVPVGIYRIVDLVGTRDKLAVTPAQLSSYGIVDSSFRLVPSGSELEFTVDPSKQDPQFPIIGDKVDIIYAQGPLLYEEHYAFGNKRNLNFSTGATIGDPDDKSDEEDDGGVDGYYLVNPTLAGHIVLMVFAWEVFAPAGILFPLFNNKARFGLNVFVLKWFKYHWVGQTIAVILGYVGTLLAYLSVESKRKPHWNTSHKIIGLVVLLLSIIQPLVGHFRPHKPNQVDSTSPTDDHRKSNQARKPFEVFHPLLGYFLLFLAMSNSFLGVEELFETSGRQTFYSFTKGGPLMETGFSGPLGIVVVCLFALFSLLIVIGWSRVLLRGKRAKKTDKTGPTTAPAQPAAATGTSEEEEQSESSTAHELVKTDSFMALAQV